MPETVLSKLNERIPRRWKVCFTAGLLVGLLAYLYKITGWLPNWDSLVFRYDAQNMTRLGRWFLPVVCGFSSFYDLPFLNGLIAIVFHALSAVCMCQVLRVRGNVTAALIGGVVASFPTVTSVMMYSYVADGYSIALFLSCMAAWLLTKDKPRYLLGAVLIALSLGIYQAYITVTVMLILFRLIDDLLYHGADVVSLVKRSIPMLLAGILGGALYSVVLKVLLSVCSVELLDYQGIDASASLAGLDLLGSLYVIKETFINCFFDLSGGVNVYVAVNVFLVAATLWYTVAHIVTRKLYRKPLVLLAAAVLAVMLPVGAGALAFVNAGIDYHNLMRMGYVVFYLLFLVLYERGSDNETGACIKQWLVLLTAVVLIGNQVVIANVSHHKAQMAYERSYGLLTRIADRIEQTPGAVDCSRILVIGAPDNSKAYSVNLTPEITGITDGYILRADDESVKQSILCSALADYCGVDYAFVSGEEKRQMLQRETVRAMGVWPAQNCIAVADDTVMIKLGSEGET